MKRHWHKGTNIETDSFITCVGMSCNPDSHYGVMHIETCECGQKRNINIGHSRHTGKEVKEFGSWHFKVS